MDKNTFLTLNLNSINCTWDCKLLLNSTVDRGLKHFQIYPDGEQSDSVYGGGGGELPGIEIIEHYTYVT